VHLVSRGGVLVDQCVVVGELVVELFDEQRIVFVERIVDHSVLLFRQSLLLDEQGSFAS
jgi:hypothetical protein